MASLARLTPLSRLQQPCSGAIHSISSRSFGFGTNWPETASRRKKASKPTPKRKPPKGPSHGSIYKAATNSKHIPPACLLATASPHVYISRSAAIQNGLDPKEIYAHVPSDPLQQLSNLCHFVHQENGAPTNDNSNDLINEVAFLGRSNVGKSSLINGLMHKKLARTSKRPGRTQQAHYFAWQDLPESRLAQQQQQQPRTHGHLVDLPGYGFAVGPDEAVDAWQGDTQQLLLARRDSQHLQRVYLLIDARHGCLEFDFSVMRWLDEACIPYSIVLTKADAVTLPVRIKWVNQVCMRYEHLVGFQTPEEKERDENDCWMHPMVHLTSSSSGMGLVELKWSIQQEFTGEFSAVGKACG